jgi:hypothetical protein
LRLPVRAAGNGMGWESDGWGVWGAGETVEALRADTDLEVRKVVTEEERYERVEDYDAVLEACRLE